MESDEDDCSSHWTNNTERNNMQVPEESRRTMESSSQVADAVHQTNDDSPGDELDHFMISGRFGAEPDAMASRDRGGGVQGGSSSTDMMSLANAVGRQYSARNATEERMIDRRGNPASDPLQIMPPQFAHPPSSDQQGQVPVLATTMLEGGVDWSPMHQPLQGFTSPDPSMFVQGHLPQGFMESGLLSPLSAGGAPSLLPPPVVLPNLPLTTPWPPLTVPEDPSALTPVGPLQYPPVASLDPVVFPPPPGWIQVAVVPTPSIALGQPSSLPSSMLIPQGVDYNAMSLAEFRRMQSFQMQRPIDGIVSSSAQHPPQALAASPDRQRSHKRKRTEAMAAKPSSSDDDDDDDDEAGEDSTLTNSELLVKVPKPSGHRHAFNYFFKEEKERVKEEWREQNKQLSFTELSVEVGRRWRSLRKSDRRKYERLAAQDSIRYQRDKEICDKQREDMCAPRVQITAEQYQEYVRQQEAERQKKRSYRRRSE